MGDDEVDSIAGGKDHYDCHDTYKDNENCWFNDNCKKYTNNYFDEDNPYCDSYSYCKGVAHKPDCKIGRIGG